MKGYIIELSQGGRKSFYWPNKGQGWGKRLEESRVFKTKAAAQSVIRNAKHIQNINKLPVAPPAGYIIVNILHVDLVATIIP